MEASGAGGQGQGGDAGQQQGQAQDAGQDINATLNQLAGSVGEMQQFLQSAPWQQQAAQQQDPGLGDQQQQQDDGIDLSFLDDPAAYDPQQTAQQLQDAMQQAVQQAVTAQVTPLQQQHAEMRREQDAAYLVSEFPELAQDEIANQTVTTARQMAETLGQPGLGDDPKFWRIAYLAAKAADAANNEGSDAPTAAHLEGGAGATQGGSSQVDLAQAIAAAGKGGTSALPFH